MSLPPSSRPGAGAIQSQPLAPPPGLKGRPSRPRRRRASRSAGRPMRRASRWRRASRRPLRPGPGRSGARRQRGAAGRRGRYRAAAEKIANPIVVFAGLDKITGRITKFDV